MSRKAQPSHTQSAGIAAQLQVRAIILASLHQRDPSHLSLVLLAKAE